MNNKEYIARKIYSKNTIKEIDKKIKLLGKDTKMDTISFLNIRLVSSILIFFIILSVFRYGYILSPILTIGYYYIFGKITIDDKIRKRTKNLEKESMHFFEVLTLSLETGRNLEEALNITTGSINGELSNEFKKAIREVGFGKSLTEALEDMQDNIPSENINNIILSLTQADLFGNSIINTLYNQIDYLREKRKLEVKAEITKIPIKISIISVLFFIPLILLIILGPLLLNYIG